MRVLFVTDLIPITDDEECAKALVPIIKELMLENETVDILRPNFLLNSLIRGKKIKKNGTYNCNGLNIRNLNFFLPFFSVPKIDLSQYEKVIAHMPSGILFVEQLLNTWPKTSSKPEIIYSVHQSDIQVMTSLKYFFYFRNKLKNAYINCGKILARAPHLKEKLIKILPAVRKKVELQISTIPEKYFISDDKMYEKIRPFEGIKFVTAANLIKRKNINLVLKAMENFRDKDFSFEIIGDGKERKNLERLTRKLKLEDKVSFAGRLSNEEVYERLQEANVFILPSKNETLGVAYLEAIASGCLCIGTKDTGIDGIIQDNINGFLCRPDVEDIKRVLKKTFLLTRDDFKNILINRRLNW